jgi:hypothetical protein
VISVRSGVAVLAAALAGSALAMALPITAVAALFFDDGTDFVGRPAGWDRQQIEEWELKNYHQPADKLDGTWNLDGMIQDAQLDMMSGWLIAQAQAMPSWKPGDEFAAARKRALAARGAGT